MIEMTLYITLNGEKGDFRARFHEEFCPADACTEHPMSERLVTQSTPSSDWWHHDTRDALRGISIVIS